MVIFLNRITSYNVCYTKLLRGINSSPHYTIAEENHLINYLLQGNSPKVLESFNKIIDNNTKYNLSENSLKELYLQFYNTAIRVINRKNLNIYDRITSYNVCYTKLLRLTYFFLCVTNP